MRSAEVFVGIDVSAATLDVAVRPSGKVWQVANSGTGIRKLATQLRKLEPSLVVMEPTSTLHYPLANAFTAAGIPIAIRNAFQIRSFARAQGTYAKTDIIDARVIAHYAEAMRPPARPMPDAQTQALQGLIVRRRQLGDLIVVESNRLRTAHPAVEADVQDVVAFLRLRQKKLERQIAAMIATHPGWQARNAQLQSVPGVGPVVAMTLLAWLSELGVASGKEIAALVGLAPLNRDSGKMRGKRTIWAGRGHVRTALYLGANVARQHNPLIRAFYAKLRAAGKPHQLAVIACARRLVVMLNAMVRDQATWRADPLAA
jgi:transposase